MPLPKLDTQTFEIQIPSSKQSIRFRPFLVKEEKILLVAQQAGDPKEVANSIKQVVNNCVISDINVNELTTFDIEYLFIKIRAKSVNNIVKLSYKDLDDDQVYNFEVDLDQVQMTSNPNHTSVIKIRDDVTLQLKYPKMDMMDVLAKINNEVDVFFEVLSYCLDKVFVGDEVFNAAEYSNQEKEEFLQQLDVVSFQKIQQFFETMPKMRHELEYTNSLNQPKKIVLESLSDFFTLG